MANQQQSGAGGQRTGDTALQGRGESSTGVRDSTYNLISVVYHALQGAETYKWYEQDVQGDQELAQFFRQICEEEKSRAQKAKQLLSQRLQRDGGGTQQQGGKQQAQGGPVDEKSSGSSGASRSSQQSQGVPGDQYGESQSSGSSRSGGQGSQSKS
ncbi:MAG TPA: hypothetical protein VNG69_15990 [Casimicrobiaceae bacterium]|nr:hypothetical protein [Casimicrobiaceae bacterium]